MKLPELPFLRNQKLLSQSHIPRCLHRMINMSLVMGVVVLVLAVARYLVS